MGGLPANAWLSPMATAIMEAGRRSSLVPTDAGVVSIRTVCFFYGHPPAVRRCRESNNGSTKAAALEAMQRAARGKEIDLI